MQVAGRRQRLAESLEGRKLMFEEVPVLEPLEQVEKRSYEKVPWLLWRLLAPL